MGFAGVDINMGCPAPNVYKHGRGAGLIHRPEVAAQLIQASKEGGLPVSVKTRLGHQDPEEYKEWLVHLLKQDIANLSVHLRTKTEMSKVPAHWELIPEIKRLRDQIAPNTLLTINGDIPDRQKGLELAQANGIDGIMIGRGIFKNPCLLYTSPSPRDSVAHLVCRLLLEKKFFLMIRRPPRSTPGTRRRQRQMCIRDRNTDHFEPELIYLSNRNLVLLHQLTCKS